MVVWSEGLSKTALITYKTDLVSKAHHIVFYLIHRGNSCSSADQSELLNLKILHLFLSPVIVKGLISSLLLDNGVSISMIAQFTQRTRNLDLITNFQSFQVLTHQTSFREFRMSILSVNLDQ